MGKKSHLKDPKTCRIFLSSPFRGIEPERKEWMSKYVPELDFLCRSHGVALVIVDMRWGITEEATENAQTVNICLREIDRSDIFIGIYAQRYGWHGEEDKDLQRNIDNAVELYPWLHKERHRSVTALEFLHGHLNKPGDIPACFAFRSKEYDESRKKALIKSKESKEAAKYSVEDAKAATDLENLKTKVVATKNKCLAVFEDYATPSEGVAKIFEVVKEYLENQLLADTEQQTQREIQLACHDAFISHGSLNYVSEARNDDKLRKTLSGNGKKLLITGQSGIGKSSLLCHWITQLKANQPNKAIYVYHFVGRGDDSMVISALLKRLYAEMEYFLNPTVSNEVNNMEDLLTHKKENEDVKDLVRKFSGKLEELSSLRRVVLVIDGIEKVELASKTAKVLYWLPHNFPDNSSIVLSCSSDHEDVIDELKNVRGFDTFELGPLDKKHRTQLCQQTLQKHGKALKDTQVEKIVSSPQSNVPIFLKTLLMEMCVFGDFRKLDAKIDSLLKAKSVKDLFQQLLVRLEGDFSDGKKAGNMIEKVLCCIRVSHQGLSEQELMTMLDIPSQKWSPIYFAIRKFVVEREGLLRLGVEELSNAVTDRYLKDSKTRLKYTKTLITYFEGLKKKLNEGVNVLAPITKRTTEELPLLYKEANDKDGLVKTLCHLTIFGRLFLQKEYELLELWKWTGLSGEKIAELYIEAVERFHSNFDKQRDSLSSSPEMAVMSFLDAATYLMEMGHFQSGLHMMLNKKLVFLETKGESIPEADKFKMLNSSKQNLAMMYMNTGRFKEAENLEIQVLQYRKRIVDSQEDGVNKQDLIDLGSSYHGLAILYTKLGNTDQAQECFVKSLNIRKQCALPLDLADSLHNLGVLLMGKGLYKQALSHCLESLKIYEEEYFGHLPPAIGVMTGNIAVCYRHVGYSEEAEKMYIKSREIAENALGHFHPNVSLALMNHGTHCLNTGKFKEAISLIKEALVIQAKCEGPKDQSATSYKLKEKLTLALIQNKEIDEGLIVFDEIFETMCKKNLGEEFFAPLYHMVVNVLMERENYKKALAVTKVLLESSKKQDVDFKNLNQIKSRIKVDSSLLKKFSMEEGLKLYPGSYVLFKEYAEADLVPNDKIDKLIAQLDISHEHVSIKDKLYENAMVWCQQAGKNDAVFQICEHAVKKYPENTTFLTYVTQNLHEQKRYEEALPFIIKLVELKPEQSELALMAADIAIRTENFPLAEKFFHRILDQCSDNSALCEQARTGLELLKDVNGDIGS